MKLNVPPPLPSWLAAENLYLFYLCLKTEPELAFETCMVCRRYKCTMHVPCPELFSSFVSLANWNSTFSSTVCCSWPSVSAAIREWVLQVWCCGSAAVPRSRPEWRPYCLRWRMRKSCFRTTSLSRDLTLSLYLLVHTKCKKCCGMLYTQQTAECKQDVGFLLYEEGRWKGDYLLLP
jgi:hypothetical protein